MPHILWALVLTLGLAAGAGPASADSGPMETLKGPVEEVIRLLEDPKYADGNAVEEQREKMWAVARSIFDFETIARATLKRHRWESMTPEQRKAFTQAFTEFLGNNYFNQVQGKYRNERVEFLEETLKTDTKAIVRTRIVRDAVEIPVDYSMWKRKGRWRIYNVYVEGASLLGNYRNEFEQFLQKDSPEALIRALEEKSREQDRSSTESG